MPFVELPSSPLAPGVTPVRIHYREQGIGRPLLILHGGWGYEIYPFDRQIDALSGGHRIVIPDRTGYGLSGTTRAAGERLPPPRGSRDVRRHRGARPRAAGAVGPQRRRGDRAADGAGRAAAARGGSRRGHPPLPVQPASRAFFETMMDDPDALGTRVTDVLAREHGERWRDLIRTNGAAWQQIAAERTPHDADLYGGRLATLGVPALVVHGARDPRTEPGELDALRAALGGVATFAVLPEGGHSPHAERATADEVTRIAGRFLGELAGRRPAAS